MLSPWIEALFQWGHAPFHLPSHAYGFHANLPHYTWTIANHLLRWPNQESWVTHDYCLSLTPNPAQSFLLNLSGIPLVLPALDLSHSQPCFHHVSPGLQKSFLAASSWSLPVKSTQHTATKVIFPKQKSTHLGPLETWKRLHTVFGVKSRSLMSLCRMWPLLSPLAPPLSTPCSSQWIRNPPFFLSPCFLPLPIAGQASFLIPWHSIARSFQVLSPPTHHSFTPQV